MTKAITDFLGVSVPAECWDTLRGEVQAEMDALGAEVEFETDKSTLWRHSRSQGTVKAQRWGKVVSLGVSGAVCAALRAQHRFDSFLAALASRPHRVTRIDAAVDSMEDAAPAVKRAYRKGKAGKAKLTRKRVLPTAVSAHFGLRESDSVETGTVYFGGPSAEARMVVYDKQAETQAKHSYDPGPWLRHELRAKLPGLTLRDAVDPTALFYSHASPSFLRRPAGVPDWVPHGEGYALERVELPTPAARLQRKVEDSVEVGKLIALAHEVGPYGVQFLASLISKRASGVQGPSPAGTLSVASGEAVGLPVASPSGDASAPSC